MLYDLVSRWATHESIKSKTAAFYFSTTCSSCDLEHLQNRNVKEVDRLVLGS